MAQEWTPEQRGILEVSVKAAPEFVAAAVWAAHLKVMLPSQLILSILVDHLAVDRKLLGDKLGISQARLSQWSKGREAVPDNHREGVALVAVWAIDYFELIYKRPYRESDSNVVARSVRSIYAGLVRELEELIEMEKSDLLEKGLLFPGDGLLLDEEQC